MEDLFYQRVVPKGQRHITEEISSQHPTTVKQLVLVKVFPKYPADHPGKGFHL
jgi:hypothetical protein